MKSDQVHKDQLRVDFGKMVVRLGLEVAQQGSRYWRRGWINVRCPFCRHPSHHHLGWCAANGIFHCWRCGFHSVYDTVLALAGSRQYAVELIRSYRSTGPLLIQKDGGIPERPESIELPDGTTEEGLLHPAATHYLRNRGFNAQQLVDMWQIRSTGRLGRYPWSVIIPIYYRGLLISWQARDYTGRSPIKYLSAPDVQQVLPMKHLVYGIDLATADSVVVVEGATGVWRIGPGAVCTYGSGWTTSQLRTLLSWNRRYILFDWTEPESLKSAHELALLLGAFDGHTELLIPQEGSTEASDPGELSQSEVQMIREYAGLDR